MAAGGASRLKTRRELSVDLRAAVFLFLDNSSPISCHQVYHTFSSALTDEMCAAASHALNSTHPRKRVTAKNNACTILHEEVWNKQPFCLRCHGTL